VEAPCAANMYSLTILGWPELPHPHNSDGV
jgi:hypothetical protein